MVIVSRPLASGRWSGVLVPKSLGNSGMVCSILGTDLQVKFDGALALGGMYTVYDAWVNIFDANTLSADEKTAIILVSHGASSNRDVVELCAGVGGIGIGAEHAGFKVVMQVDFNSLAIEHLMQLNMGDVVHGDITDVQTIKQVHLKLRNNPAAVASGFNCQPFSQQGDQGGFQDPRSNSFIATLRACYLLQPLALILECTPGAGSHPQVKSSLQNLATIMNWQIQDVVFDLADRWPSMRKRWWALLSSCQTPSRPLKSWPMSSDHSKLSDIIQVWPTWSPEHEQQLSLTADEMDAYLVKYPEPRLLDMGAKAATMLHSYANALGPCPCSCRAFGFRPERLEAKGLRGFLIMNNEDQYRYVHPREACLLLTFPDNFPIADDLKATLCMLGQSAAPLQSHWIFLHLFEQLFGEVDLDFAHLISRHCNKLLFDRHHHWPIPTLAQDVVIGLQCSDGFALSFRKVGVLPAQDLLNALRAECEWGERWSLMDGCVPVPSGAYIHPQGFYGPYMLLRITKRQMADQPTEDILLYLSSSAGNQVVQLPAGAFGFEACLAVGCSSTCIMIDSLGHLLWPDQRLWRSQSLWISNLTGAGSAHAGLHMDFIRHVATMMFSESMVAHQCTLIGLHLDADGFHQHFGTATLAEPPNAKQILICILADGHWTLLTIFRLVGDAFLASFWDGEVNDIIPCKISTLIQELEQLWQLECEDICLAGSVRQTMADSCGTVMLNHLGLCLQLFRQEDSWQLETMHPHFLQLCDSHEYLETETAALRGQGRLATANPSEQAIQHQLETLLREKGVPAERTEERAALGIKKLGIKEISEAFQNVNPWGYLKAIGSRPHNSFQWIKSDELQSKIRARASSKFGIQHNKQKGTPKPKKAPAAPLLIDAEQLQLVPATFFSAEKEMKQLTFTEVVPGASGVAFCSAADAIPFLRDGKPLGKEPLALLTTTVVGNDQIGTLPAQQLRFPAQFRGTNEPVLIQGHLIQLGQAHIVRGNGKQVCDLPQLDTQTLKIYVYKDQWEGDWTSFVEQPVRSILAKFPALNMCKAEGCGDACPKFHNAVDEEFDALILDLWSVLVRVPASATIRASLASLAFTLSHAPLVAASLMINLAWFGWASCHFKT